MSEQNAQNWRNMHMDDNGATSHTDHDWSNDTFEGTHMAGLDYRRGKFRGADCRFWRLKGGEQWDDCDFFEAKVQASFLAILKKCYGVTLPDGIRTADAPPKEEAKEQA
jgi:hypothetical protein